MCIPVILYDLCLFSAKFRLNIRIRYYESTGNSSAGVHL
jgi:hypothetical protein